MDLASHVAANAGILYWIWRGVYSKRKKSPFSGAAFFTSPDLVGAELTFIIWRCTERRCLEMADIQRDRGGSTLSFRDFPYSVAVQYSSRILDPILITKIIVQKI